MLSSTLPHRSAAYPTRSFLTGICFSVVTVGSAWIVLSILQLIFPSAFNSILSLVFSLPIAVVTLFVGLSLGLLTGLYVARRLSLPHPVATVLVSSIIGVECVIFIHSRWPFLSLPIFWACSLILSTLAFVAIDTLSAIRLPAFFRVIGYVATISVLVGAIVTTKGQGVRQAREEALTKIDYALYLPVPDSGFSQPGYISPSNSDSTDQLDFEQGVTLEFRGSVNAQVYESKNQGDLLSDCSPYIPASDYSIKTCELVDQTDTIKIYLETQTANDGTVTAERYYGLTPTTFVTANLTNPTGQHIDSVRTQQFLKALQPVSVAKLLDTLHQVNPQDF